MGLVKGIRVEKDDKDFIDIYDEIFIGLLKLYINKDKGTTIKNIVTYFDGNKKWENIKNKEKESREIEMLMRT